MTYKKKQLGEKVRTFPVYVPIPEELRQPILDRCNAERRSPQEVLRIIVEDAFGYKAPPRIAPPIEELEATNG